MRHQSTSRRSPAATPTINRHNRLTNRRNRPPQVESALVAHPQCAEAAVVPIEHPIKGQALYAFVTLMEVRVWPPHSSYC